MFLFVDGNTRVLSGARKQVSAATICAQPWVHGSILNESRTLHEQVNLLCFLDNHSHPAFFQLKIQETKLKLIANDEKSLFGRYYSRVTRNLMSHVTTVRRCDGKKPI